MGSHAHAERGGFALMLMVAGLVVGLDQATKEVALDRLADGPIDVVEGAVTLRLTFNSGGAFGLGRGAPLLFLTAGVAITAFILVWGRRVQERITLVALGLILGGGLGNLWDRVLRDLDGRVVDFVDLHVWPVFNLADSCIVAGVALLFLLSLRSSRRSQPP